MSDKNVEIYLKEKMNEVLDLIFAFEGKVVSDREELGELQAKIVTFKHNNPEGTYEDVKEELIKMQEVHYYSFMLEQDLKNQFIRVETLNNMAVILGVDLGIEGDKAQALENINQGVYSLFGLDSNKQIILLDTVHKQQIEGGINSKKADTANLQEMYRSISAPKTM